MTKNELYQNTYRIDGLERSETAMMLDIEEVFIPEKDDSRLRAPVTPFPEEDTTMSK